MIQKKRVYCLFKYIYLYIDLPVYFLFYIVFLKSPHRLGILQPIGPTYHWAKEEVGSGYWWQHEPNDLAFVEGVADCAGQANYCRPFSMGRFLSTDVSETPLLSDTCCGLILRGLCVQGVSAGASHQLFSYKKN